MEIKNAYYQKIFIKTFLFIEGGIIGGSIYYFITYGKMRSFGSPLIWIISSLINFFFCLFFYFNKPNSAKIISKSRFMKIGKIQGMFLLLFPFIIMFAYFIPIIYKKIFPMPVVGFYALIIIFLILIWYLVFFKQILQILDILTMFIKDKIYPNTWPAEMREENRNKNLEKIYLRWLYKFGSDEERSYYNKLSFEDTKAGSKYAATRIKQIKEETGYK